MDRFTFWSLIKLNWSFEQHKHIERWEGIEIEAAAIMLGRSVRSLRNWERRKLMPPRRKGGKGGKTYYYKKSDIEILNEVLRGSLCVLPALKGLKLRRL